MTQTLYDAVSYAGVMQPEAHPDRLAALGRLLGLDTAPVQTCRVLELGCNDGTNLLPIAAAFPHATFLGIDLSPSAIARGQSALAQLGWRHITLRQMDLLDATDDFGRFDYIIAHGVYSWVPAPVRQRLLEICRQHLAPQGIAYISYNVLPGCRQRQVAWDLMRFHCAGMNPQTQVAQARHILQLAAEAAPPESAYGSLLKAEAQRVADNSDSLIFHDDLAANTPVHFHEFAAHAADHHLQYLCDATFEQDGDSRVSPRTAEFLRKLATSDLIRREQYADFVLGRPFRRSLLCHAEATLHRPITPDRLRGLRFTSPLKPLDNLPPTTDTVQQFRHPHGKTISSNLPLAKAALLCLHQAWPQSILFEELLAQARERSAGAGNQQEETLGSFLLSALAAALVGIHSAPLPIRTTVSDRPRVSALARWQATRGSSLTTLTCSIIHLEGPQATHLISLLDGTHDVATLSRILDVEPTLLLHKLGDLAGAGLLEA